MFKGVKMGIIAKWKYAILHKAFKDDEKSYLTFDRLYPKFKNFIWTIATFMGAIYIFFKIHGRIGFEKTLIILMVSIAVYLRSWLKAVTYSKQ